MNEWAVGVTEFPVEDKYSHRATDEECTRCGAKPGFYCFDVVADHRGNVNAFPVSSHLILREVPVRHQAKGSGALVAGW